MLVYHYNQTKFTTFDVFSYMYKKKKKYYFMGNFATKLKICFLFPQLRNFKARMRTIQQLQFEFDIHVLRLSISKYEIDNSSYLVHL